MAQARTEIEGETLTHRILWACCRHQMEAAESVERGGLYFHLAAMLMAYLAYEAYLNFLGDRVAPQVWADERQYFRKAPYKGIDGKLKKICEVCGIAAPDKGSRPYETIVELRKLRDFLAHGKPDRYVTSVLHPVGTEPPLHDHDTLSRVVSPEKSKRAVGDVRELIELLHGQAKPHVQDIWFGNKALGGILGYSSGASTVTNQREGVVDDRSDD